MCGRYTLATSPDRFQARFDVANIEFTFHPRYNVAPSQVMPVVTRHSPNSAELMRWGLVPFWAKDPRIGFMMINARAETVAEKPAYRKSLLTRRCLVPATGFFEWRKPKEKGLSKQPFYIRLKSRPLFAFAGLYEVWKDAEGKELKSYTIITCEPNEIMRPIHDRMPVILPEVAEDTWLNPAVQSVGVLSKLLVPYDAAKMEVHPVSKKVNDPQNDRPDVLDPTVQKARK